MAKTKTEKKQLRDLAKDEESYQELLSIIENNLDSFTPKMYLSEYISKLPGILWYIIYPGDKNKNVYSESFKSITGYSVKEINHLPDKFQSLIHEDDLTGVQKALIDLNENSSKNSLELIYRINTKDHNILWLKEYLSIERDDNLNIVKYESLAIDISDIKQKEIELSEKNNQLVEINSSKDRFISIVSHDLRSPFTSLLGFSEILLHEPDLPEEEKKEYLEYIYDASKTQLQLINHLLDWSRLQTGRLQIEPRRMNVKTIVSNCVSMLTGSAIRKNIEIKTNLPDDLFCFADERLIIQSITNLLSNAIKFTPSKKKIFATADRFKEGKVEIVIRDEGVGISTDNQTKLFSIDQKFSLSGTAGEKGSGLGLTLVKEIVEKHGGDVWFYSELDKGSEFHITLPEAKNLVIVIEESNEKREFYREMLNHCPASFEISFSSNGYEAMGIILKKAPSLIITNHHMPLLNGIQLVEAIRKKETNSQVPVIIVGRELQEEILEKYSKLQEAFLINEPVDKDIFIELVTKCIS